jgi:hypothetical protein
MKRAIVLLSMSIFSLHPSQVKQAKGALKDVVTSSLGIDKIRVGADVGILYRRAAYLYGQGPTISEEEFKHMYALDKIYKASDIIAQRSGFIRGNASAAMLHYWLSSTLLTSPNPKTAIARWRSLEQEKNIDGSWREPRKVFDMSSSDITSLYKEAQNYHKNSDTTAVPDLVRRIFDSAESSPKSCDDRETLQEKHPLRNLASVRKHGFMITLAGDKSDMVKAAEHPTLPLVERLKNKRLLTINGLPNSKVALLVHDHFDHFLTFDHLDKQGILERYKPFLRSVGDPAGTDIFCREGELVASVAYDWRWANFPYFKQISLFNYDTVSDILKSHNLSTENQQKAYEILQKRATDKEFIERLPIAISGVYTELMQQRVKHGLIKIINPKKKIEGHMGTMNPEYLALIIESYEELHQNKRKFTKGLENIQLSIEDFLIKSKDKEGSSIHLSPEKIESFDVSSSVISRNKADWIRNNLGAMSDRNQF